MNLENLSSKVDPVDAPSKFWERLKNLFEQAVQIPEQQRSTFVDETCGDNSQLKSELLSLLESFATSENELESPISELIGGSNEHDRLSTDAIAGYTILEELHRGGQGVVYLALQQSTNREVAIKVMLEGPFAGYVNKRRFEREIELISSLRHPNIVSIFDTGVAKDQYYYVMEYVDGQALDDYVVTNSLSVENVLKLFAAICDAIDRAHHKGVVHRDLKPSNILVDSSGEPQVLDFGLAKAESADLDGTEQSPPLSLTGQIMGTPAYMSPEQASGRPNELDTRSDVYSLGVLLYELLSGTLPYRLDKSMAENLATIQHVEPKQLVSLNVGINGEVSTIVQKALAKEKARRYPNAGAFGDDIRRFLRGDPIEARRASAFYLLRKTLRRHLVATIVAALFLLLTAISSVVGWTLYLKADRASLMYRSERNKAELRGTLLNRNLYFAETNLAGEAANESGGLNRAKELVSQWAPGGTDPSIVGWEWYFLNSLVDQEMYRAIQPSQQWCVAWGPESQIAAGGNDGSVRFGIMSSDSLQLSTLGNHDRPVRSVDFSCDGKWLASGSADGRVFIWDVEKRTVKTQFHHAGIVLSVCWHPSKQLLASGDNRGIIKVWDMSTGQLQGEPTALKNSALSAIDWSPDGRKIVVACGNGSVGIVATPLSSEVDVLRGHRKRVFAVRWSPDGQRIASADSGGTVIVWDANDQSIVWSKTFPEPVWNLSWRPDSEVLATAHAEGDIILLGAESGEYRETFHGHSKDIWGIDWHPDGRLIASAAHDRSIRIWDTEQILPIRVFREENVTIRSLDWSIDGRRLACSLANHVQMLDVTSGEVLMTFDGHSWKTNEIAFSPDGNRLGTTSWDKTASVWDANSGKLLRRFVGHDPGKGDGLHPVHAISWSSDGKKLATGGHSIPVLVRNADTGEVVARLDNVDSIVNAIDWHPTENLLAVCGNGGNMRIFNALTGDLQKTIELNAYRIRSIKWSPSGDRLAASGDDSTIRIWDFETGKLVCNMTDHRRMVTAVSWHPDGRRLASGSQDNTVRIWDTTTGKQAIVLRRHTDWVNSVAFSHDGLQLGSVGEDGQIVIWDARIGHDRARRASADDVR